MPRRTQHLPDDRRGPTLNPGAHHSYTRGCTCPMIQNHYGQGIYVTANVERVYQIAETGPLHGSTRQEVQ